MSHATAPSYKETLNLPKTTFPMKANLAQNESLSRKRWEGMSLHESVNAARAEQGHGGEGTFVFHDGPPYTSGPIHVGHLLNKVLKDMVVRSRLMDGKACRFVPGWDCHGLPIEHRVMTDLIEAGKSEKLNSLTDDQRRMAIRRECRKYSEKFFKLQREQMQQLLTLADYDQPYMTMQNEYERGVLEVFADLIDRGLVYRALKAVHWSIANETALADAELEYYDREDTSVYVTFKAADPAAVARVFGAEMVGGDVSFMIWTTTPWTLPANVAVAVNEGFEYALVDVSGTRVVVGVSAIEKIAKFSRGGEANVLGMARGKSLVGLRYKHPFVTNVPACGLGRRCDPNRVWSIVSAGYVTLDDGTGLVHTAPGHGHDDYNTGVREELPIYCPVSKDGRYDATVPAWLSGKLIWDANGEIVERLRASGHLYFDHRFTHSYPHDWRGKTPVIFRATEQWFIGVDKAMEGGEGGGMTLREAALRAIDETGGNRGCVRFVPEWGRNRMRGMLESRPDWCVSRQRAWGLPIPAFETEEGVVIMTSAMVRAVARRFGEAGSDAWFTETPEQLLKYWDASADQQLQAILRPQVSSLRKTYDILDVWFESGSSWNAVLRQREIGYPADLYLEGSDQHRGWFQASMLTALGSTGKPPYKSLLTHGFIVDKEGMKMSKSVGNTIEVADVMKHYGADVCRWWVSSLAFENDVKADLSFFDVAGESYRKVRNTLRFLLSNLDDCSSEDASRVALWELQPTSIDRFVLSEAVELQRKVRELFEQYEFRRAHQLLYDFCNDTLSAFYCAAVKDRLYCDAKDSPRRRTTQAVMWKILESLVRLLAPLMPHTADEAFRVLWKSEQSACVHAQVHIDLPRVAVDGDWWQAMEARDRAFEALESAKKGTGHGVGIENPLDAEVLIPDPKGVLRKFAAEFPDMLGVSRVVFVERAGGFVVNDLRSEAKCDRCWRRDRSCNRRSDGGMLCDRCAEAVGVG